VHVESPARKRGRGGGAIFAPAGSGAQETGGGIFLLPRGARGEIDRGALGVRGGGATAGLDPRDTLWRERAGAHEIFGVPFGVDVVGDRRDIVCRLLLGRKKRSKR